MKTVARYASLVKFSHTVFAMPFALIAYFYALPRIECRRQIVSARSVTKYGGFRIPVRGSQMTLRIPNRGMEVVETEFS